MAFELAQLIDHTQLRPDATTVDIERLCVEALEYDFAAVCVNPYWVPRASVLLRNSGIALCSVVGFPFGASASAIKHTEAALAVTQGATEIDVVVNLGALKGGEVHAVEEDLRQVRSATEGRVLKVIIEAAALTDAELTTAVDLAAEVGADFVKTSTGFHPIGGARVRDVQMIRKVLAGRPLGIKAAGGIRSREFADELLGAGATRLGTSAGVALVS